MAKLSGFVKMEGTLDGLTFFKSKDGYLIRTKGGVSKERMMNDPAFARTRENGTEFASSAVAGKMIRVAAGVLITNAKDGTLTSRLMHVLAKVKNLDSTSVRGARNVAVGMTTPAGKQLLKGFNMNERADLSSVLRSPYSLDTANGEVVIADFIPKLYLLYPTSATHVSITSAFLNLNFVTGEYAMTFSLTENLPLEMTPLTVTLTPSGVPAGTGIQFYFLLIEFFQEVNAIQYPLNNGSYNALTIIAVV